MSCCGGSGGCRNLARLMAKPPANGNAKRHNAVDFGQRGIYCVLRMKAHLISCDPVVRISLTMALTTICWLACRTPSSK